MNDSDVHILFAGSDTDPFIVLYKPSGMPSAPLYEREQGTALSTALELFPELQQVVGKKKIECGLLHRLDTETRGLLLIARTQVSFDALNAAQREGRFVKKYAALCSRNKILLSGFPLLPASFELQTMNIPLKIESRFRPYGHKSAAVRPVLSTQTGEYRYFAQKKAAHERYVTEIESYSPFFKDNCGKQDCNTFHLECSLVRGFRHQVRCHLAWLGFPIIGDHVYNPEAGKNDLHLHAHTLEFPHPLTGKICVFQTQLQRVNLIGSIF